jgi:antitoxin MazE
MRSPVQVCKWGNSLAIRIPAAVVEALGLKEGDEVTLRAAGDGSLVIEQPLDIDALFERVRKLRRPLPPDFKFHREEAHARGKVAD